MSNNRNQTDQSQTEQNQTSKSPKSPAYAVEDFIVKVYQPVTSVMVMGAILGIFCSFMDRKLAALHTGRVPGPLTLGTIGRACGQTGTKGTLFSNKESFEFNFEDTTFSRNEPIMGKNGRWGFLFTEAFRAVSIATVDTATMISFSNYRLIHDTGHNWKELPRSKVMPYLVSGGIPRLVGGTITVSCFVALQSVLPSQSAQTPVDFLKLVAGWAALPICAGVSGNFTSRLAKLKALENFTFYTQKGINHPALSYGGIVSKLMTQEPLYKVLSKGWGQSALLAGGAMGLTIVASYFLQNNIFPVAEACIQRRKERRNPATFFQPLAPDTTAAVVQKTVEKVDTSSRPTPRG